MCRQARAAHATPAIASSNRVGEGGGTRDIRSGGVHTESAAMLCHANEQPHLSQSCPRCIVAQTARCGVTIHSTQTYRPRFCRFCVAFVGQWQVCSQCPRGAPESLLERAPIHRSPLSGLVPHCGTILITPGLPGRTCQAEASRAPPAPVQGRASFTITR